VGITQNSLKVQFTLFSWLEVSLNDMRYKFTFYLLTYLLFVKKADNTHKLARIYINLTVVIKALDKTKSSEAK